MAVRLIPMAVKRIVPTLVKKKMTMPETADRAMNFSLSLKVLPPMVMGAGRMMNRKAQAKANAARTMREYGLRAKHTMVIADSTMK